MLLGLNVFVADGEAERKSTQEFDKIAYWKKLGKKDDHINCNLKKGFFFVMKTVKAWISLYIYAVWSRLFQGQHMW